MRARTARAIGISRASWYQFDAGNPAIVSMASKASLEGADGEGQKNGDSGNLELLRV